MHRADRRYDNSSPHPPEKQIAYSLFKINSWFHLQIIIYLIVFIYYFVQKKQTKILHKTFLRLNRTYQLLLTKPHLLTECVWENITMKSACADLCTVSTEIVKPMWGGACNSAFIRENKTHFTSAYLPWNLIFLWRDIIS